MVHVVWQITVVVGAMLGVFAAVLLWPGWIAWIILSLVGLLLWLWGSVLGMERARRRQS